MLRQATLCLFLLRTLCQAVELPTDYETNTAEEKLNIIFDHVKATEGDRLYYPNALSLLRSILFDDFSPTVDHISDLIPYKHEKRIHSVGAAATMKFDSNGKHEYTGMFQGTPHAIVRLSSARAYSHSGGPIPGLGVKFFRDGIPSANFVAMHSVDPQESGNFFHHEFSNHIDGTNNFAKSLMVRQFEKASSPAGFVGLSDIASYTIGGEEVEEPIFPYEIILFPNQQLKKRFANMLPTDEDLEHSLLSIPEGTKIYDVHARATPSSPTEPIGSMTITSKLMYSRFGDESLFFRHQKMEDDLKLKPDWRSAMPDRRSLREKCPLGFDEEEHE